MSGFEACVTCEQPWQCETMVFSVVAEQRAFTGFYELFIKGTNGANDFLRSSSDEIGRTTDEVYERLRDLGCSHDGVKLRSLIAELKEVHS